MQIGESNRAPIGFQGVSFLDRQYWNGKEDQTNKAKNWNVIDDSLYPSIKLVNDRFAQLGSPGATVVVQMTAGEALGGQKVVRSASGSAMLATSATAAHGAAVIGITTGAATSGAQVGVQCAGLMTDPSFSFTPGGAIYCGTNGVLTQSVPTSGFILQVGVAISATSIMIKICQPISV